MPASTSSRRRSRADWPTALVVGAATALVVTLRFGYVYGTGDHDDLLPPVIATLDPSLFLDDAYVRGQSAGITVRAAFRVILVMVGRVMPLAAGVAFLHCVVLSCIGASLFSLARALQAGRGAAALGALLAVGVFPAWTLGGNAVVYPLLTPEGMAWAAVVPALVLWLRGKRRWAAALLGVAAWLHALAGILPLCALALVYSWEVWSGKGFWREAVTFFGLGALVAFPIVGPAMLRQTRGSGAALPDGLDPFTLFAQIRFPHHLLPLSFGLVTWAKFAVVVMLGVGGYLLARRRQRPMKDSMVLHFCVASGAMAAAAVVGIYGFESLFVARLQVFKLTVLLTAMMCLGMGAGIASVTPREIRRAVERFIRTPTTAVPLAVVMLIVGIALLGVPRDSKTDALARWAKAETPVQTVFMVPPGMDNFRVQASRSVVVTWKSVPFRTDLATDWWTRLMAIAPLEMPPSSARGLSTTLAAAYASLPDSTRQRAGAAYGARYAVLPLDATTDLPVMARDRRWQVVDLAE